MSEALEKEVEKERALNKAFDAEFNEKAKPIFKEGEKVRIRILNKQKELHLIKAEIQKDRARAVELSAKIAEIASELRSKYERR